MTPTEWNDKFAGWASPPGQTEQDKTDNAVRAVRAAIAASAALAPWIGAIAVSPQGSYYNRTNVRADSDVDVRVTCSKLLYFDLPQGATPAQFGITVPPPYAFEQYRADVGLALTAHFGRGHVLAGKKAFDIHQNTYRIAADVVPTWLYRDFRAGLLPPEGTAFMSEGRCIINYPEQHYANGVAKNTDTGRRFKAVVRILKRLRYDMIAAGLKSANGVQSYELESLVWNVPTTLFGGASLRDDVRAIVLHLWDSLESDQKCAGWREVNGIKPLFGPEQPWGRVPARAFLVDLWAYAELE